MINSGDELGRTQRGNNNGYCQDNDRSYLQWDLKPEQQALLEFTQALAKFRASQPVLQRRNFFLGDTLEDSRFHDLVWFRPDGEEMLHGDWARPSHCLGYFLGGDAIGTRDPEGRKVTGDSLLIYLNAAATPISLTLPGKSWGAHWEVAIQTALLEDRSWAATASFTLPAHAVVVLRLARTSEG
jgi:glycogen operon protein